MQFLRILFWAVTGGFLAILGWRNWTDVTMALWGDIQLDIKLPILLCFVFLLGWLPTYLVHKARLWRAKSRLDNFQRQQATAHAPEPVIAEPPTA